MGERIEERDVAEQERLAIEQKMDANIRRLEEIWALIEAACVKMGKEIPGELRNAHNLSVEKLKMEKEQFLSLMEVMK